MDHLRCVVERITYQNAQNGYSVIKCRVKGRCSSSGRAFSADRSGSGDYSDLVTVVGSMPDVHVGSVLELGGSWRVDPKYGRQFSMETFEETLPATVFGIEKYLGSGLIKGIGPKYAKKIVQEFGKDTLEVIETDPDRLNSIPGIGKMRVEKIKQSWQEQKEIKNIMLFLQGHDVSTSHATKIYRQYGNDSIEVVKENPYRLADDIWGIGFRTADTIAEKMGFGHERYARLRSGILYTLNHLSDDGHCFATREMLLESGAELLSVEDNVLSMTLDEMIRQKDVITEDIPKEKLSGEDGAAPSEGFEDNEERQERAIYLPPFFFSEMGVVRRMSAILKNREGIHVNAQGLSERISRKTRMHYDQIQMQAITDAVTSKILILTGGPGTGKTTTTLGIITAFREAGAKILLAAPTGRAAKRLSEATRMEAKTIHRLLEVKPPDGYQKNEENPLSGDVLIVDECSMIDIMLMYNLLKAVPDTMTLILVGDIDQLPSVGAGNVLRDIIDSGCFPVVRLTRIFRQAQTSRIIMNAHRINAGKLPDISNGKNADFFFMDMEKEAEKSGLNAQDSSVIAQLSADAIVRMVKTNLPNYYHTPSSEIQVLTPMQRGVVGATNLNQALQAAVNPSGQGLKRGGYLFRAGDKVMQIRNNYDKEVFNGDIGIISDIDLEEKNLRVLFDDRLVEYDISELDELVLAYATTIHKSQGSEYPIVVIPVLMSHYIMLQRNLIYTGITRAKKILLLVGTKKALAYTVRNVTVTKRNTMLRERLQKALEAYFGEKVFETEPELEETVDQGVQSADTAQEREDQSQNTGPRDDRISYDAWLKTDLFERLSKSEFRSRFHLRDAERSYLQEKGMDTIRSHAEDFVRMRLAPAVIPNDGKQTPMKGHPVFIGQHATATCCRGCLSKWHGIPAGRELTGKEQAYVVDVLMEWIRRQG